MVLVQRKSLPAMKRIALALHGGVVNMVGRANSEGEVPAYRVDDSQGQCMLKLHDCDCHGDLL